jgi:hypothetical protein
MENTNIELDDVKEYRPRKRDPAKASVRFQDNYNVSPDASNKLMDKDEYFGGDGVANIDSGVMMSTSEIIDFGEATDSWINRH